MRGEKSLTDLLLRPKPVGVLVALRDESKKWYAAALAKECGLTYIYATLLLKTFLQAGLVRRENAAGRTKYFRLTDSGLRLANTLGEVIKVAQAAEPEPPAPPREAAPTPPAA